jgi:hypothetical protein
MRQQRFGGHAAVDWPLRRRRLHDRFAAGAAGPAGAAGDAHPPLRRHDVGLLAAQFADRVQQATAARAVADRDVDQYFITRPVRWQGAVVTLCLRLPPCPPLASLRCLCLPGRLTGGDILLEVLKAKLQLIGSPLLRVPAELLAQQTLDQQRQLLDLGVALADRALQHHLLLGRRRHHLAQHPLQRGWVVRQGGEIDRHGIMMIDRFEPPLMNPA